MHPMILLLLAILTEVIGTAALKYSVGFTKLVPSLVVVAGYGISFYLFAIALKSIPLGPAYAIWSGVGTAGTMLISLYLLHEKVDLPLIIGVVLILLGVFVMSFFSKSITA
ncbi:MAG: multidrug efflux SMR transporter [Chloroflexi bacterium]|nr:multidrug efflux SMR transporter [Chloroflexota bacterium]